MLTELNKKIYGSKLNTYKSRSLFLFCLLLLFFFLFLFSLHFSKDLCVVFTGLFKLFLKLFVIFFWSEFGTELLCFWLFVWNIISSPGPSVVAGLKLFKLAEDVLVVKQVIDDNFVRFFSSNQDSDEFILLVLEEFQLSYSSKNKIKITFPSIQLSICRF